MAQKRLLTNAVVARLPLPEGRAELVHDSKLTGFCVSITPAGRRVFYYYGRINGRPRRIKLGNFPDLNATDARDIAKGIIGDAMKGKDVSQTRKAGRRTLGELFDLYLESHAKPRKRTWERDVKEFDKFLSNWKRKPLAEIRRGLISERITEIVARNGRGAGHKVRALLSKMFAIAVKHEWVEYNPVTGTDRPTYEPRDRYLKPDEVKRFFAAVDSLQRQATKDLIYLAVFTGARRANLCEMRWDEIDLERGIWTIPKAKFKGKREVVIPLIPAAAEILRRRHDERVNGTPWVFPGGGKTGHIVEPKFALEKVREQSGITDLRFHDLRRTLGSWMNNSNVNLKLIQSTLGHANIQTTAAIYTHSDVEAVRASVAAVIDAVMPSRTQSSNT